MVNNFTTNNLLRLATNIKLWAKELGFDELRITDIDLSQAEKKLQTWLKQGFHGEMHYMEAHGSKRTHPEELIPNTIRILSVRMNYWPKASSIEKTLLDKTKAFISRYALGRDYHKVIRKKLELLAQKIREQIPETEYRVFCDSAPVLEKPIAEKAGLGWIGKHTNLIHSKSGSWFFLGTIYTNLPLPIDTPQEKSHCGSCTKCLEICPTQAIIGPYQLDARRCISYLTIELKGHIPEEFRTAIGNRIYGCDDCQWVCPWNKFATETKEPDFQPRHKLDQASLIELFFWTEKEFEFKTRGSAIRRIGYESWIRNIAIALGNAPTTPEVISALKQKLRDPSPIIQEHAKWSYEKHKNSKL